MWAVLASIVFHVLAMYGIKGPAPILSRTRISSVDITLRIHLDLKAGQQTTPVRTAGGEYQERGTDTKHAVRRTDKRDTAVATPEGTAANHKIAETDTKRSLDMEAIRDQVRNMGSDRTITNGPTASIEDRPILGALAKALGEKPRVLQEMVQNDGSRIIRFSGHRCLHVPAHIPYWRAGGPVPVEWVVTNCGD